MTSGYQYKAKLAFVVLVDDGWLRIQICTKKEKRNMNLIVNKLNGKCMRELYRSANQEANYCSQPFITALIIMLLKFLVFKVISLLNSSTYRYDDGKDGRVWETQTRHDDHIFVI
jgi:hypothetical protein